jgi:hypothetical protein
MIADVPGLPFAIALALLLWAAIIAVGWLVWSTV